MEVYTCIHIIFIPLIPFSFNKISVHLLFQLIPIFNTKKAHGRDLVEIEKNNSISDTKKAKKLEISLFSFAF